MAIRTTLARLGRVVAIIESIPAMSPARRQDVNRSNRRRGLASQVLLLLVAVSGALAFHGFLELVRLEREVSTTLAQNEQRLFDLRARVRFDSDRRRLVMGIRDEILRARPRVGPERAFELASLVLDASEKHPSVDPLLLVAVGVVESGYDSEAVSRAGARGLYQIHPATGRSLARKLGWEFDEALLHDPERSTEMAASYLAHLGSAYNDVEMILAEYNGGPLNAGYLRANAEKLAGETRAYVPRVIAIYERLGREIHRTTLPLGSPPDGTHGAFERRLQVPVLPE